MVCLARMMVFYDFSKLLSLTHIYWMGWTIEKLLLYEATPIHNAHLLGLCIILMILVDLVTARSLQ